VRGGLENPAAVRILRVVSKNEILDLFLRKLQRNPVWITRLSMHDKRRLS